MISNIVFANNVDTPITLASEKVLLARVAVQNSPAFAMVLTAENVDLQLLGEVSLSSAIENTVLSKNVTLSKADSGTTSSMHVNGNYLVCGSVTNADKYLNVVPTPITADQFASYLVSSIVTFDPNGGTVAQNSKVVYKWQNYGTLPVPERQYFAFAGWYTAPEGGEKITDSTIVTTNVNRTLYAHWNAVTATLQFDADGGTVGTDSMIVYLGEEVGTLPAPTRDYHNFMGWFTADGTEITGSSVITEAQNLTVTAKWELKPVSGWVKASEVPGDAQVLERKWTYTKTTTTESRETSLAGYKQISSQWVESGRGSVNYSTAFPSGFDHSHWIYTSFNKAPLESYENATSKRTVSNNWAGYVYWHWMYDTSKASGTANRAIFNKKGTGSSNGYGYKYFGAFTSSKGNYSSDTSYCNSLGIRNYIIPERTSWNDCQGATRWFRFDYYTSSYVDYYKLFTYQKVEDNLESTTQVTPSDTISNVQEWVQYREK